MKIGVIGGGIVGSSAAYYLAKSGFKPIIFEKDSIAAHASGYAQGGLNPHLDRKSVDFKLHEVAWKLHNEIYRDSHFKNIFNPNYIKKSIIVLATQSDEEIVLKKLAKNSSEMLEDAIKWLNPEEIRNIDSRVQGKILGGILGKNYLEVNSLNLSKLFHRASLEMGAEYVSGEVTDILLDKESVKGVEVNGQIIYLSSVLVCSGPWTKSLLEKIGISIPLFPVKGQILRIENPGKDFQVAFSWDKNYLTQKEDDLLWVGTTEEKVGFDDSPTVEGKEEIMNSVVKIFPIISKFKILKQTACLRPVTSDNIPIMDSTRISGLYIATGTGRKGIKLGPAIGNLMSKMILGEELPLDISDYSLKRFKNIAKPSF